MLFRALFIASSQKFILETLTGWLNGMIRYIDCWYLAKIPDQTWESHLPPFSLVTPPPPSGTWYGMKQWSDNLTVSRVYLATWAEDGQAIPNNVYLLSFDFLITVLRSSRVELVDETCTVYCINSVDTRNLIPVYPYYPLWDAEF